MAHCEVNVDSNIVHVAFSHSGARIAILTQESLSVFAWSVKSRPLPAPLLESSYPLSQTPGCRPRQAVFLGESEVYVLSHFGPSDCRIERTMLETRETTLTYAASEGERIHSIFSNFEHDKLWFSKSSETSRATTYSNLTLVDGNSLEITPFEESPSVDTHWASSIRISGDQVFPHLLRAQGLY